MGIEELEETIVTYAEIADLRGDPQGPVEATILESKVAKGKGYASTKTDVFYYLP